MSPPPLRGVHKVQPLARTGPEYLEVILYVRPRARDLSREGRRHIPVAGTYRVRGDGIFLRRGPIA
eukprot:2575956-Pyramimonas_sp.AAC.1